MQFSIKNVLSETLGISLNHWIRVFLVSILAFVLIVVGSGLFGGIIGVADGLSGVGAVVVIMMMLYILMIYGATFNYFVRLGALGPDQALGRFSSLMKSGLINGVKFLLIGLLLAIVLIVVSMILVALGLDTGATNSLDIASLDPTDIKGMLNEAIKQNAEQSASAEGLAINMMFVVAMSFVYAFFSANLTKTALDDKTSDYETPHTVDFAVVLVLLYVITMVPSLLFMVLGMPIVSLVLSIIVAIFIGAAIAVAHGVRHRMCAPTEAEIEYQPMAAPDKDMDVERDERDEKSDQDHDQDPPK